MYIYVVIKIRDKIKLCTATKSDVCRSLFHSQTQRCLKAYWSGKNPKKKYCPCKRVQLRLVTECNVTRQKLAW